MRTKSRQILKFQRHNVDVHNNQWLHCPYKTSKWYEVEKLDLTNDDRWDDGSCCNCIDHMESLTPGRILFIRLPRISIDIARYIRTSPTVEEKRTQWSNNLIDYIEAYNKNIPSNQLVGQFRCKLKHTNTIRANVIRKGETHTCNEAKIWRDNNDTYGAPTPSHSSLCQVSLFNWAIKLVMCLRVFVIVCASVRMWFFSSSSIISESDENRW